MVLNISNAKSLYFGALARIIPRVFYLLEGENCHQTHLEKRKSTSGYMNESSSKQRQNTIKADRKPIQAFEMSRSHKHPWQLHGVTEDAQAHNSGGGHTGATAKPHTTAKAPAAPTHKRCCHAHKRLTAPPPLPAAPLPGVPLSVGSR